MLNSLIRKQDNKVDFMANAMNLKKVKIKDRKKLFEIFKIISWFDQKRWDESSECNYNWIHYSHKNLTPNEKILTHWLSYITDRQMSFKDVWIAGGFVISDLVYNFSRNHEKIDTLLNEKNKNSFYKQKKDVQTIFNFKSEELVRHTKDQTKSKYLFVSREMQDELPVKFVSRFITDDIQVIEKTLTILDKHFERNILIFISTCINRFSSKEDFVRKTAAALNLLTYEFTRGNLQKDLDEFDEIFFDDEKFQHYFEHFNRTATSNKKRLWCCIRDYLKRGSPYYQDVCAGLTKEDMHVWQNASREMMNQIEIPGDVWNNKSDFSTNLLINVVEFDQKTKLADVIRSAYEQVKSELKNENMLFYPEQFDVTFNFVPRMCSSSANSSLVGQQCKICPFGGGCQTYCHQNETKNCPITAYACGYVTKCTPDDCPIKGKVAENICRTIVTKL